MDWFLYDNGFRYERIKCLTVFWICLRLGNCTVNYKAMYSIRHIENRYGIFSILFFQVYVSMFNHIQRIRHIQSYWRIDKAYSQAYSRIFRTLCNSRIFATLPYSELWHIKKRMFLCWFCLCDILCLFVSLFILLLLFCTIKSVIPPFPFQRQYSYCLKVALFEVNVLSRKG